jgi:hypothetical protein
MKHSIGKIHSGSGELEEVSWGIGTRSEVIWEDTDQKGFFWKQMRMQPSKKLSFARSNKEAKLSF